jgi:hypothetical protein
MFRKLALIACTLVLVACGPGGEQNDLPPVNLPIANELQQQPNWCWVATTRQVLASLPNGPRQSTPPQCALAAAALGTSAAQCCGNPTACNVPGTLQQQQFLLANYGGRVSSIAPPTDPFTLYQTIQSGYGVILFIRGSGLVGHFVVLRGMFWQGGVPYVVVNDPLQYFPASLQFQQLLQFWQAALVVG